MEIRWCISFHSIYKYAFKQPFRSDLAVQLFLQGRGWICVWRRKLEQKKGRVFFLSRRERSQLKLCPKTDRLSHVILAVNSSIYLEVKHIPSLRLICTCRDQEYWSIFLVSHWMTKCILKQRFTHFSCFRYFSLYHSVNTKLWRTWQLDKSCGRYFHALVILLKE